MGWKGKIVSDGFKIEITIFNIQILKIGVLEKQRKRKMIDIEIRNAIHPKNDTRLER